MDHSKFVSEEENDTNSEKDMTFRQDTPPSTYKQLFIFADKLDLILMIIASIFSIGNGVSIVFYSLPIGQLVGAFSNHQTPDEIVDSVLKVMIGFLINSVVVFFNCWMMTAVWTVTSQRQMVRARKKYFQALLVQQQAWHDKNRPTQLCERMYAQIAKVHQALVTNVTSLLTKISMGCAGIIIALATGWKMALVMIAFLPAMMLSGFVRGHYEKKKQFYLQTKKLRNDSQVIEIFDNIKAVKMMSGENYECERYYSKIEKQENQLWNHGKKGAIAFSIFFFCIIMNYTLGFWYGSKLVSEKQINENTGKPYGIAEVIVIFFTLYISNLNLSALPDNLAQFSVSRFSMGKILLILRRIPKLEYGTQKFPEKVKQIRFRKVSFEYDAPLFKSLDLQLQEGITAIIGPSGCGKSTIISLLMRFYDPKSGSIQIINSDSIVNIAEISEQSLRENIGYVGQEPVLIGQTIRQALLAGDKTDHEIYKVLQILHSVEFVDKIGLDNPYTLLSGGQKQRIAIARALLRKPKILILDESTSALDRRTQQIILRQLKKVGIDLIIMIAHRPETIQKADKIIKVEGGRIVFKGSYMEFSKENNLDLIVEQQESKQNKEEHLEEKTSKMLMEGKQDTWKEMHHKRGEQDIEEGNIEEEPVQFKTNYICRLMKMNKEFWHLYVLGIIGAVYFGCIFPTFSYILSKIIITLLKIEGATQQLIIQYQYTVSRMSLMLLLICLGSLLLTTIRWVFFQFLTCKLASKAKLSAFYESINRDYAEIQVTGPSSYSHIITKNCENLKYIAGNFMPTIIENVLTLIFGLCIAFIYSWTMTLVAFGILPLVLFASKLMMAFNHGMQSNTEEKHKNNHKLVVEAISNIKTVRSCALEKQLLEKFGKSLQGIIDLSIKYGNLGGIMFGIGQTLIFCMIAIIFYIGALLIKSGLINNEDMFISIIAIMFAGVQAGGNLYFLSQIAPAKYGAAKYFSLMGESDQVLISEPDLQQESKQSEDLNSWQGTLKFQNIGFKYPTRNEQLFRNFSFEIKKGEKVAIVGESGSGKSTITSLLFKLYAPTAGRILLDGVQIKFISRKSISRILGIVMQEPVLFNRSVYENVRYNTPAMMNEVVKATKQSRAYDFIVEGKFGSKADKDLNSEQQFVLQNKIAQQESLLKENERVSPEIVEKFMKNVGNKGSYLSGGQKQRVALARSLLRCPKILVLDEATSALDTQNEKLVQGTLQDITGMTQIIIAHRLSTIRNCDRILVMDSGRIVEEGPYDELMKIDGWFRRMVNAQGSHK